APSWTLRQITGGGDPTWRHRSVAARADTGADNANSGSLCQTHVTPETRADAPAAWMGMDHRDCTSRPPGRSVERVRGGTDRPIGLNPIRPYHALHRTV